VWETQLATLLCDTVGPKYNLHPFDPWKNKRLSISCEGWPANIFIRFVIDDMKKVFKKYKDNIFQKIHIQKNELIFFNNYIYRDMTIIKVTKKA
jgi:hypothetical protein